MKTVASLVAMLAAITLATGSVSAAEAKLPSWTITSLEVWPQEIRLDGAFQYQQLLITGVTAEGERIDLTRDAAISGEAGLVTLDERRMVRPIADGEGRLTIEHQGKRAEIPFVTHGTTEAFEPDYKRDIMPILAKQGCNSGTCHGGREGKNGFQLSLRGYDPEFDYRALTDDLAGRRFNRAAPDRSLMLLKPVGEVPHQGGVLFDTNHPHYRQLLAWIEGGVTFDREAKRVERIELLPQNPQLPRPGMSQQMTVVAHYPDGTSRDVTAEAFLESSVIDTVEIDARGLAKGLRRGEGAVLARYEGAYAATAITVMGDRTGFAWQPVEEYNEVDGFVYDKLQRAKILPSDLVTDGEFIRRIYLDTTGLPPSPEAVRAFLEDSREPRVKRAELVEKLVGSPEFVTYWTYKWCDLLQVNRKYLGVDGTWAMRNWIEQAVASNKPYDEFVYEILTGTGSSLEDPGAAYFKIHNDPGETTETTTQLFLAIRFNCNKCHDHPFERWTQDQYYHFAAYFAQVGRKRGAEALDLALRGEKVPPTAEEIIFDRTGGEVKHDRTGEVSPPAFPFEHGDMPAADAPRRVQLAEWLTSSENPYFAKSFVNRMWSYLLGKGLIDPVDDIRAGNPPSNPELLDWLTAEFIAHDYDVQWLVKTILQSRTYQHSVRANEWNADDEINFSRAIPKRLSAEVLLDTIHSVLDVPTRFAGVPAGYRAMQLPDSAVEAKGGFLDLFGRPPRESPCECERSTGVMLSQALNLVNGPVVADAVADPKNRIARIVAAESDNAKVIDELFLAILARRPTAEETEECLTVMNEAPSRLEGGQDIAWALLNTPAFLFNR